MSMEQKAKAHSPPEARLKAAETFAAWFSLHRELFPDIQWPEIPERFVEQAKFEQVVFDIRPYERWKL